MKILIIACCCVMLVSTVAAQKPLNVMTFNIRLDIAVDSLDGWPYRKDLVAGQILFHEAHIVGVQEALPGQMMDLQQRLKAYKYVGVGRDDGKMKGEFSAIFYDTTRLKVRRSATFWLSETPGVAGQKGWDAAYPRVVTWAEIKDRQTNKQFFVFNTHFDHVGQVARRESAKMLLQKINEIAGTKPCIVTGDFNAKPSDEPIQIITDPSSLLHLTDTKRISKTPHYGPEWTFSAFKVRKTDGDCIDYIFTKQKVAVLQHATLSQIWNTHFSSDHFPVFARVAIQ